MNKLIKNYHQALKAKVTEATYQSEKYILPLYSTYLNNKGIHYTQVTEPLLENWLEHLQTQQKNSPKTCLKKINRVRDFYNWAMDVEVLLENPISAHFYQPKITQRLRKSPKVEEALSILTTPNGKLFPLRNRALLEVCYGTGLRRSEIRNLNLSDIQAEHLFIVGKGGRERIVPLGDTARTWVLKYISEERHEIIHRHNPFEEALFVGQGGRRLAGKSYNVIFKKQIQSPWSPHCFRHACAGHMLEKGAGIRVIQKLLGHEKLSTTQVYTKVRINTVKEMLEKYHPRG